MARMLGGMSHREYVRWQAFLTVEAEEREQQQEKAQQQARQRRR